MRNQHGRFDRLKAGTGHDGKSRAFAKPGEKSLSVHHDPNAARAGDVGLAPHFMKPAARKALHPVAVHNGMHPRQIAAAGIGGMAHATGYVDEGGTAIPNSAAAVPHAYGNGIPKVREAAPPAWNNKSRTGPIAKSLTDPTPHSIGQCLMDAAKVK